MSYGLRQRWSTPWWLVRAIEHYSGQHFSLDVCAERATAKASRYYGPRSRLGRDGLEASWDGETVWCNPPYDEITPWILKMCEPRDFALLVPPRTDQLWWHHLTRMDRARLYPILGRVACEPPPGVTASAPSAPLVIWSTLELPRTLERAELKRVGDGVPPRLRVIENNPEK